MKLKFIALLFFLFQLFQLNGQIAKEMKRINADSLQQVLPTLTGTEKIDALNKIAFKLCYKYPDSCISIANQTIRLSESFDYKKGEATGYLNLANGYLFLDSLRHSVVNYLYSLRIFESIDVCMEMGYTCRILAYLNWRAGRIDKSLQYTRNEIRIGHLLSDYVYKGNAIYMAGVYFTESFNFDSSNIYLDKAIALAESHSDTILLTKAYFYKGHNAISRYEYTHKEEDKIYLRECIHSNSKCLELDRAYFKDHPAVYNNLADAHLGLGSKEDSILSLRYTDTANLIADTLSSLYYTNLLVYWRLGKLKANSGDYKGAIDLYLEGINKANKTRARFSIKNYNNIDPFYPHVYEEYYYQIYLGWVYEYIYLAFSDLGNFENAHEYYILWEESKNRIFLEDNKNLIAMLEAESENEKIQNQIAGLERDKQLNEMKAAQTRNLNIGIIVAFVILLLVGILFLRQNKLKNEHKSTLLEQKLLRLQMNPHFIFNALSSIHSLMNPIDVNRASDYLGNFSRLLRSSLESSREDYILLEEEISSLKNYLELQQLRYENKFDYEIDVDPKIDLESAILPPMLLQPFIENAIEHGIKHKEAKGHIRIRFKLENKKLTCEIEDDGVGREKAWEVEYAKKGKHKSLATEIIHDRIKILNKKLKQKINLNILDLKSETNEANGTMVRLDLPYLLD